jgi:hypothetical protein
MKLLATRTAQYPLFVEFTANYNNWVVDSVDGTKKTLGSTVALATDPLETALNGPVANTIVFDGIKMPPGAVITGGELIVETAYVGPTAATLSFGTAANTTAYLAAASLLAVGRTAVTLSSPLLENAGVDARITLAYTVANATAGKFRVRLQYTVDGRASENQAT